MPPENNLQQSRPQTHKANMIIPPAPRSLNKGSCGHEADMGLIVLRSSPHGSRGHGAQERGRPQINLEKLCVI